MSEPVESSQSLAKVAPLEYGSRKVVRAFSPLPYTLILMSALFDTAGEILLKTGATSVPPVHAWYGAFAPLGSFWTWMGIVIYVLSLLAWLYVLRTMPLSVAFPLVNVVHVFVPLGAKIFLHEHVSAKRWLGISLIILGVFAIVKPLVKAEEKL